MKKTPGHNKQNNYNFNYNYKIHKNNNNFGIFVNFQKDIFIFIQPMHIAHCTVLVRTESFEGLHIKLTFILQYILTIQNSILTVCNNVV